MADTGEAGGGESGESHEDEALGRASTLAARATAAAWTTRFRARAGLSIRSVRSIRAGVAHHRERHGRGVTAQDCRPRQEPQGRVWVAPHPRGKAWGPPAAPPSEPGTDPATKRDTSIRGTACDHLACGCLASPSGESLTQSTWRNSPTPTPPMEGALASSTSGSHLTRRWLALSVVSSSVRDALESARLTRQGCPWEPRPDCSSTRMEMRPMLFGMRLPWMREGQPTWSRSSIRGGRSYQRRGAHSAKAPIRVMVSATWRASTVVWTLSVISD